MGVKYCCVEYGLRKSSTKKGSAGISTVKVKSGIQYSNLIEITDGLTLKDSIASNAQFLMDSESFIKIKK
jgi:Cu(I)/Ag(I) efflux system membrane fusion protein